MWPFKKKGLQVLPRETPPVEIGERFKYLGVEMICSRHWEWPYEFDVVVAEYVNNIGEIKQAIFCPIDWESLKSEIARKG